MASWMCSDNCGVTVCIKRVVGCNEVVRSVHEMEYCNKWQLAVFCAVLCCILCDRWLCVSNWHRHVTVAGHWWIRSSCRQQIGDEQFIVCNAELQRHCPVHSQPTVLRSARIAVELAFNLMKYQTWSIQHSSQTQSLFVQGRHCVHQPVFMKPYLNCLLRADPPPTSPSRGFALIGVFLVAADHGYRRHVLLYCTVL